MRRSVLLAIILLLFGTVSFAQADLIRMARMLYQKAPTEKESCKELMKLPISDNPDHQPLLLGYKGSATMMMASHVFNPFTKWSYFNTGRNMLDEAVESDRTNVELRYLRYMAQTQAPSFLGYNEHIEEDRMILLESVDSVDDSLRKRINTHVNTD